MIKKLKKLVILLVVIMMILPTQLIEVLATKVGDSPYLQRGERGFYSIQYDNNGKWSYITYDRVHYTDENGIKRLAYCIDPGVDGVGWVSGSVEGYTVDLKEALSDVRLWRVYRNGYPYSTPQQLGVETEDDAYLATKQAGYWVIRGWSLDGIRSYFRAGQTEIDGQNLADIQRRGQKVIDAIYNLVNNAYNGNQTPADSGIVSVNKSGQFVQDSNVNYYSQKYTVSSQTSMSNYTVTNIAGFPEGSYVANLNGGNQTTFSSGEQFKIMIPKTAIKNNISGKIYVQSRCLTYPVYFGASRDSNYQNYAVTVDPYGDISSSATLDINAFKSKLIVVKKDKETGKRLSGITFKAKYSDGTEIGDYTTNSEGIINITGLKQGTIILTETKTQNQYILDQTAKEITIGYNDTINVDITNEHKRGNLKIYKVDLDNNKLPVSDVEFEITDQDGLKYKAVSNKDGIAYIENIRTGIASIREIKTNKIYKLSDKTYNVEIKYNDTAEITIKNEKLKGQIKVIKVDAEHKEIKLEGVEFQILDKNNNIIETIKTNKNGEAISSRIPIGEYKIKEVNLGTNTEYILNKDIKTINVEVDKTNSIEFGNVHKKGNLKVIKVDKDDNDLTLGAVEFDLLDSNHKLVAHLVTDVNGEAQIININTGNYILKETKTKKEYQLAVDQNVVIEWNKTLNLKVENEKKKGQIKVIKVDAENKEIKLEGVEFQILDKNNHVIETIKTNKEGEAVSSRLPIGEYRIKEVDLGTNTEYILNEEIKTINVEVDKTNSIEFANIHKKGNLKIYKVDLDNNKLPVSDVEFEITDQDGFKYKAVSDKEGIAYVENIRTGIATIKEIKTNKIYKLSDKTYNVEIKYNDIAEITIENEKLKGKIEIYKVDAEDKQIKLEGVEFQVINSNNEIVEVIKTNKEGYAITSRIPIGEYKIKEIKTDDMHIINEEIKEVVVTTDNVSNLEISNERIKGQIKIIKTSEDDNYINGQESGMPIENVKFEVYDTNGELVDTIITDKNGYAITKKLDKAVYKIKEVESGEWYLLNENEFTAEIKRHNEIVNVNITNESEKPDVDIEKDGIIQTTANQEIKYDFHIKNTGNTALNNFIWTDVLPTDYITATRLITGTYNQDLDYAVYYKTNKNDYRLLKDNLNTQVNNYISFTDIQLEDDEFVTEFKADFGTVDIGFESVKVPQLFVNVKDIVKNDDTFTNKTRIEGYNKTYLVWDEDTHTTKIYEKKIEIKLPRTGC